MGRQETCLPRLSPHEGRHETLGALAERSASPARRVWEGINQGTNHHTMPTERRNRTVAKRRRRAAFEASLQQVRALGLPKWAVECYRRIARVSGQLPHQVVARVAILGASQILQNPDVAIYPVYDHELPTLPAASANGHRPIHQRSKAPRKD